MISYSKYKLLKEETPAAPAPPAGGSAPSAGGSAPPSSAGAMPSMDPVAPPGFGDSMSSMSGGMPGGMGGGGMGGGMPGGMGGAPTDAKPSGLKSSNVWDVLEKLIQDQK